MINSADGFRGIIKFIIGYIQLIIPVVAALALFAFIKGLVSFIFNAGDTKSHAEGRNLMVWGVIALFIMVSVYGIIYIFYADIFDAFNHPFGIPLLPK